MAIPSYWRAGDLALYYAYVVDVVDVIVICIIGVVTIVLRVYDVDPSWFTL